MRISLGAFSQLTNTGYIYDALGRNTLIPSIDTPNGNGAITLAYNTNDQVTQISQAGTTTNFTYEAEGRRLNETSNGQTVTRHYTDSSDNPAWTTQTGVNGKTEIYSPSLGTGLNVTTTIQNGTQTGSMQLHDLRGNTVTTIDLTTNTTSAWSSYDEYGNPETTNPANTNNINYSTYGQAERATNTTGLILMGARAYNPQTNQFTSPDPVKGGNENSFAYPSDSINKQDYSGESWLFEGLGMAAAFGLGVAATALFCGATLGVGCLVAGVVAGAVGGALQGVGKSLDRNEFGTKKMWDYVKDDAVLGAIGGGIKVPVFRMFARRAKWAPGAINFSRKVVRGVVAGAVAKAVTIPMSFAQNYGRKKL